MHWILIEAHRVFSSGMWPLRCSMWNQVLWPGTEPGPSALGVQSLSHWTTREVLMLPSWYESSELAVAEESEVGKRILASAHTALIKTNLMTTSTVLLCLEGKENQKYCWTLVIFTSLRLLTSNQRFTWGKQHACRQNARSAWNFSSDFCIEEARFSNENFAQIETLFKSWKHPLIP